ARFMHRLTLSLLALVLGSQSPVCAQSADVIKLTNGADLSAFNQLGQSNWRVEDGVVVADAAQGPSYLVSKERFADFKLSVEFYASDDANSGVFLRCQDASKITDRNCYEANIFDQRPDPSYGTGAIVLHAEVTPMPKAGGQWNTYEITANGRDITLVLNGYKTAYVRSGLWEEGYIALQHASGTMKFRNMTLERLAP
ncbi:MAG: DUF1080 domain-containing protein, partial [Pseudomonadota bacterium]